MFCVVTKAYINSNYAAWWTSLFEVSDSVITYKGSITPSEIAGAKHVIAEKISENLALFTIVSTGASKKPNHLVVSFTNDNNVVFSDVSLATSYSYDILSIQTCISGNGMCVVCYCGYGNYQGIVYYRVMDIATELKAKLAEDRIDGVTKTTLTTDTPGEVMTIG